MCSSISSVIFCFCVKCYFNKRKRESEKIRLQNTRILIRHKIKPFIQIDEEVKDEFEQYDIIKPQIIGDENV